MCSNLAGIFNSDSKEANISIALTKKMVAVTGETGSGKTLLVSKLVEIVAGNRATASSVPRDGDPVTVEVAMVLTEPHLSWVQKALKEAGVRLLPETNGNARMRVQRILERGTRLFSTSKINDSVVTLKTVRQIVAPLIVVVDTPTAAAALSRPNSRMAVLDSAVHSVIVKNCIESYFEYKQARQRREELERKFHNMFPALMTDEIDAEMLGHWVVDLDVFQRAIEDLGVKLDQVIVSGSTFSKACKALTNIRWSGDGSATVYSKLLDLREAMKEMDTKIDRATQARDALVARSSSDSAMAALERARKSLLGSVANESNNSPLSLAAELVHDRFNLVEQALLETAVALDNDKKGLISIMESTKSSVNLSLEDIDSLIADWNMLARKHGVSPYSLPACHHALQCELTGNNEARSQLPMAQEQESKALTTLSRACTELSRARIEVANTLSAAVTTQLSSLGMTGTKFVVDLHQDSAIHEYATENGIDRVDFLLQHEDAAERGGSLDEVASDGEKARIMLAMECELPGSAGALCRASQIRNLPPIAVIYDEIDAHVGGRAAVAVARMLAKQSGQVITITHSPSVAAIAETHIVVQKHPTLNSQKIPVTVKKVDGDLRTKELARMASGDLASDEAESFASALLRDAAAINNACP
jgi:DNA repair ATPase RecN